IAAALIVYAVVGKTYPLAPAVTATPIQALIVETLYTFALCLVVLNVATSPDTEGNSYYGLAIGFTILVAAVAGGGIAGGACNPDVGTGPILVDAILKGGSLSNLWLYLVGPFLGGALAAWVYRLQTSVGPAKS